MRVAIAGKGGTGKTTIAGTLARVLARSGRPVVAVDADTNPNLAAMLGVSALRVRDIANLPVDLLQRRTEPDGTQKTVFAADPDAVLAEYGVTGPDNVQLVVMGKVHHGGVG